MSKSCGTCGVEKRTSVEWCKKMYTCQEGYTEWKPLDEISFSKLNNLTPTEQSCTFKLLEEVGEVMQIIGKESGASGELVGTERDLGVIVKLVMEYMDVAQASATAVFTLSDKYDLDLATIIEEHNLKLKRRGYMK